MQNHKNLINMIIARKGRCPRMLESERIKLKEAAKLGDYMSIAINKEGEPVHGGFVPWNNTASAFNMRTPKVTLAADDLQVPEIMQDLKKCRLAGVYIFTSLENYDFVSEFKRLQDLFIRKGENIRSLSFIRDMPELFMFYLENAELANLDSLIMNFNHGERLPGKCMGFYHCKVEDTSALKEVDFVTSELLIWPVEGDSRERWKMNKSPGTFRFYMKRG